MPPLDVSSDFEALNQIGATLDGSAGKHVQDLIPAGNSFMVFIDNTVSERPLSKTSGLEAPPREIQHTERTAEKSTTPPVIRIDYNSDDADSEDDEEFRLTRPVHFGIDYASADDGKPRKRIALSHRRSSSVALAPKTSVKPGNEMATVKAFTIEERPKFVQGKASNDLKRKSPQANAEETRRTPIASSEEPVARASDQVTNRNRNPWEKPPRPADYEQKTKLQKTQELLKEMPIDIAAGFWGRWVMQKVYKKVKTLGTSALTTKDVISVRHKLRMISVIDFRKRPEWLYRSGIRKIVSDMANVQLFGDEIATPAAELREHWRKPNYAPFQIPSLMRDEVDDLESSGDELEEDSDMVAAGSGMVSKDRWSPRMAHMMRGIDLVQGKRSVVHRIDPDYKERRRANVWGHNGLQVGDWWPYQICALRDGAHGSKQGGIYGNLKDGAFSIVSAPESIYSDQDKGDVLLYAGTTKEVGKKVDAELGTKRTELTRGTQMLCTSALTGKPVRVLRKGPSADAWHPKAGLRYDGLYCVEGYDAVKKRKGEEYLLFRLTRLPDQTPLKSDLVTKRPTRDEWAAFNKIRDSK